MDNMQAASPLMVIQQLPTPDIYSCQHPETATPLKLKHATHTEQFQVYDRINQKQKTNCALSPVKLTFVIYRIGDVTFQYA
ncbi:hypothetical protein MTR_6g072495 [Medicago truncatula]|uniref:Uncharacterized protein n=1 Tax=Medicago truncatula TaxID=3880 RepID=A0A072UAT9_MEDTR|nr:hypothetical protein MTR_6g072495 [Medicago truncatula]